MCERRMVVSQKCPLAPRFVVHMRKRGRICKMLSEFGCVKLVGKQFSTLEKLFVNCIGINI